MNVSKIKKIAVLTSVFSVGALAYALAERAKVAGQTPPPTLGSDEMVYDPRPLGLDGRPIGALPPKDRKTPYAKTYYVGDLVDAGNRVFVSPQGTVAILGQVPDVGPLVKLIEQTIAPGTWMIGDQQGHMVPTKVKSRGLVNADAMGSITPFYLSVSLIIDCTGEVHDDLATFFRGLRDLINSRNRDPITTHVGPAPVGPAPITPPKDQRNSHNPR